MLLANFWLFLLFLVTLGCCGMFLLSVTCWAWFFCVLLLRGASEASEQSERAKLSDAFSGFPLLTHAFVGAPLLSQPFLAFAGLCWSLLGFTACYYCWGRAKRASKASERSSLVLSLGFPCFPMLLLAHACFLLLSVASLLCMLSGIFF